MLALGKLLEIRACRKELLALAGNDQCIHVGVVVEPVDDLFQRCQRLAIAGVGRRIGDGQQGRVAAHIELDLLAHVGSLF